MKPQLGWVQTDSGVDARGVLSDGPTMGKAVVWHEPTPLPEKPKKKRKPRSP